MNRIVLIGNGFDLAHGLQTSYGHFLEDYWDAWYTKLGGCNDCQLSDEFYDFSIILSNGLSQGEEIGHWIYIFYTNLLMHRTPEQIISRTRHQPSSLKDLSEICDAINGQLREQKLHHRIHHKYLSNFFKQINEKTYSEKWVDIENEYYRLLKTIHHRHSNSEITQKDLDEVKKELTKLNKDLKILAEKLTDYLIVQGENITDETTNKQIEKIIFEPFNLQDISNSGEELFLDDIFFNWSEFQGGVGIDEIKKELHRHEHHNVINTKQGEQHELMRIKLNKGELNDYLIPDRTLFLNFNYTNTAERLYAKSDDRIDCEVVNIHGELNNPNNPIIFGYGDEMDEDYKKISNLNDNDYLHNIKSIRYLETDNYRKLLQFIDSAPYQVIIMGHSCGNSDRTLLNTLFEHKNCLSIKPYYHKKEDGTDNYIDIIQNISRDFNDMTLMRDRVVNKTYCEQLPQNK